MLHEGEFTEFVSEKLDIDWDYSTAESTPAPSHVFSHANARQDLPNSHPAPTDHPNIASQQNHSLASTMSQTLPNSPVTISRKPSDDTLVDKTYVVRDPKSPLLLKIPLKHWIRRSRYLREMKKSDQLREHIDAALHDEKKLPALVGHLFPDDKNQQAQSDLADFLISQLNGNREESNEKKAKPVWLLPSAALTVTTLSQICAGNIQQAQQVLTCMSQELDASGKKRVSEDEDIEEKAWLCMQRLASVQGYAEAAVLKLQGREPSLVQPEEMSKEVALIRYLQAWDKLRSIDPTLKAAPSSTGEIRSAKVLSNPEAEQALLVIKATHKVMKGAEPLTSQEFAANWAWGQGIYDSSTLHAVMSRLLEVPATGDLLTKDYLADPSQSNEYDKTINNAAGSLCFSLKEKIKEKKNEIKNDPALQKKMEPEIVKMELEVAKLEIWLTMEGKGLGEILKVDEKFVKNCLEHHSAQLESPQARKIFGQQAPKVIRKLTKPSWFWLLLRASTNQIPILASLISKKLDEELFSTEGLQKRAAELAKDDSSQLFKESIEKAHELSFGAQKPLNDPKSLQEHFEKVVSGPTGSSFSVSHDTVKGLSTGGLYRVGESALAVSILPDAAYTYTRGTSYSVKRSPTYGGQITVGKKGEHAGRIGAGLSVGYNYLADKFRLFVGLSATPSLRGKLTKIEEAGLHVGHDDSPELNQKVVQLYFKASNEVMEEWQAIRANPSHPDHPLSFGSWCAKSLTEKLAVASTDNKFSLSFNQHNKFQGDVAVVTRAGVQIGPGSFTSPGFRIGGGFNFKKTVASSETTTSKIGAQQETAQGSVKEIKIDGVLGVSVPTPDVRSPINKALGRTIYKEEQESYQVNLQPNPNNRFAQDILFESRTATLDPTIPDTKWGSLTQYKMNVEPAHTYSTMLGMEKIFKLDREEKQRQQRTSNTDTLTTHCHLKALSRARKNLTHKEEAWHSVGQKPERYIEKNQVAGLSFLIKILTKKSENITTPATQESHQPHKAAKFTR